MAVLFDVAQSILTLYVFLPNQYCSHVMVIHSHFVLLPLEHRASVNRFVSLPFFNVIDSR
jgi:hypothetical protein